MNPEPTNNEELNNEAPAENTTDAPVDTPENGDQSATDTPATEAPAEDGAAESGAEGADTDAETPAESQEDAGSEDGAEGEEPQTTLDEEAAEEETEAPEVTGLPEGVFKPEEAPEGEYLAVVNSQGNFKYVLTREDAVKNAGHGGFFVRVPSTEELAEYKRVNKIVD